MSSNRSREEMFHKRRLFGVDLVETGGGVELHLDAKLAVLVLVAGVGGRIGRLTCLTPW